MRIQAPLDAWQETDALIQAGADELYCGVFHAAWEKLGRFPNARHMYYGNLRGFDELREVVTRAQSHNVPVYICFNDYYAAGDQALLEEDIQQAIRAGVDGCIVADFTLVPVIRRYRPDVKIVLSSLTPCFNTQAVSFFAKRGVDRIVLPLSQMSMAEIRALNTRAKSIGMELEVFVNNTSCKNVNGYCMYHHLGVESFYTGRRQERLSAVMALLRSSRKLLPSGLQRFLGKTLWSSSFAPSQSCRGVNDITVHTRDPAGRWSESTACVAHERDFADRYCALCAFYFYLSWGIAAGKIAGRGKLLKTKLLDLDRARLFRDAYVRGEVNDRNFTQEGRKIFAQASGARCADDCEFTRKQGEGLWNAR